MSAVLVAVFLAAPAPTPDPERTIYSALKKNGVAVVVVQDGSFIFVVRGVEGQKLVKPLLIRQSASGHVDWVLQATDGRLKARDGQGLAIHLSEGSSVTMDGSRFDFKERVFEIPVSLK